jgi:hypothetical protein
MHAGSDDLALEVRDGVFVVPVLHERLESADAVRRALQALSPDAVAIEVPSSLSRVFTRAVLRLPAISVMLYETEAGDTIYLPIHPADPAAEAARWALERNLPVACADLDVDGYADHRDPLPDPYAMTRIGLRAYADAVRTAARPPDAQDAQREAGDGLSRSRTGRVRRIEDSRRDRNAPRQRVFRRGRRRAGRASHASDS